MIVIGLTGSVGVGKTETSNFFKRNKIPVFESDYEINLLYKKRAVIKKVKEEFPKAFLDNNLSKAKLAEIVFQDTNKLRALEGILYTYLRANRCSWIRKKFREKKRVVVFDVPLLFEKENVAKYDKIILVTCSEKVQKQRVLRREGWNEKRLFLTRKQQLMDEKKIKLADIVINTDRGKRYVFNRITNILNKCYYIKQRTNDRIIFNFQK